MRLLLGIFLICLSISANALDCDKKEASDTKARLLQLATWESKGNRIDVNWIYPIEKLNRDLQLAQLQIFAGTDACLSGEARYIRFYRNKKLIGIASPSYGIRLSD